MNETNETTAEKPLADAREVLSQLEEHGPVMARVEPRAVGRIATPQAPPVQVAPTMAEMTEEVGALFTALAKAQGEFGDIERTMTVQTKNYSFDYAPLDVVLGAVRPALSANGIALIQFPATRQHVVVVRTMLVHGESGQRVWNDLAVGCNSTDAKDIASAITYARRYALQSLLGIAPDTDDDGHRARGETAHVQDRRPRDTDSRSPVVGPDKSLITSCRPIKRGDRTIYHIKATTGECFTEDEALFLVAQAAMRAEQGVVLVTEVRHAETSGKTYQALVEIGK